MVLSRFPFTHAIQLLGTAGMQACVKLGCLFQFGCFCSAPCFQAQVSSQDEMNPQKRSKTMRDHFLWNQNQPEDFIFFSKKRPLVTNFNLLRVAWTVGSRTRDCPVHSTVLPSLWGDEPRAPGSPLRAAAAYSLPGWYSAHYTPWNSRTRPCLYGSSKWLVQLY